MRQLRAILVCALLLVAAPGAAPATPDVPPLTQARLLFGEGKYEESIQALRGQTLGRTDAHHAHYIMACASSHLRRHQDALREYKIALLMQPSGIYANQCKLALAAAGETVSGINLATAAPAAAPKARPARPVDTAISTIKHQVSDRLSIISSEDGYGLRRYGGSSSSWYSYFLYWRALNYSRWNNHRTGQRYNNDRRQNVRDSAAYILSALAEEPGAGKTVMVPEGTNLYVRNYASVPEASPPHEELRAVAGKLKVRRK